MVYLVGDRNECVQRLPLLQGRDLPDWIRCISAEMHRAAAWSDLAWRSGTDFYPVLCRLHMLCTPCAVVLALCIRIPTIKPMYSIDAATEWQDRWRLALVVCVRLGLIRLGQVST